MQMMTFWHNKASEITDVQVFRPNRGALLVCFKLSGSMLSFQEQNNNTAMIQQQLKIISFYKNVRLKNSQNLRKCKEQT